MSINDNRNSYKDRDLSKKSSNFNGIGITIGAFLIILIIPSIFSYLMERSWMNFGTQKAESWMSFWGGYLGAFVGLLAVIYTTNKQIQNSKSLMIDQIKEQTEQIKLSANIHDNLEKQRIYLNTILEKNLELQRKIKDLEDIFVSNKSFFLELIDSINKFHITKYKVDTMNLKIMQRKLFKKKSKNYVHSGKLLSEEDFLDLMNEELNSNLEYMSKRIDLLEKIAGELQKKVNEIIILQMFINASKQHQNNNTYENKLSELVKFVQDLLIFITTLCNTKSYKKSKEKDDVINIIEEINEKPIELFKDLNLQSESHIKYILESFIEK